MIVVSHDRYFMDKVVDHLLVFNGEGKIDDFPGNYSEYREWKSLREHEEQEEKEAAKKQQATNTNTKANTWGGEKKRKLSFKEKNPSSLKRTLKNSKPKRSRNRNESLLLAH